VILRMGTGTRKRRDRRRSRRRGGSRTVAGMAATPSKPARPAAIGQAASFPKCARSCRCLSSRNWTFAPSVYRTRSTHGGPCLLYGRDWVSSSQSRGIQSPKGSPSVVPTWSSAIGSLYAAHRATAPTPTQPDGRHRVRANVASRNPFGLRAHAVFDTGQPRPWSWRGQQPFARKPEVACGLSPLL
jgi:hypothetical protein